MDVIIDFLSLLDNEMRKDIFIGFTGLLIAVVVFVAEITSNQNNELIKILLLKKTKIQRNLIFIIIIFVFLWLCSLFSINEGSTIYNKIFYCIIQFILNFCIFLSMIFTIKMFILSIKINSNSKFFSNELDKYVKKRIKKISKEERKKYLHKLKDEKKVSEKFFKKSDFFSIDDSLKSIDNNYEPVFSLIAGYVINFEYKLLTELENKIRDEVLNSEYYEIPKEDNHFVFFVKGIGEKVNQKTPIAYCNKKYINILKGINKTLILDSGNIFLDDELNFITDNLFKLFIIKDDEYDGRNILLRYLEFLYKNNYISAKNIYFNQIEDEFRLAIKNNKNEKFSRWLMVLSNLSYSYDNLYDYSLINNFVTTLYYYESKNENTNIKKLAYNYANHFFIINFYSIQRKSDYRYYDDIMSNLFSYVTDLIRRDRYDAIFVLFDNIYFEEADYWNELTDFDMVNFQFSIGIVYCLMLKYSKLNIKEISSEQKKNVKKLIDIIREHFVGFYDCLEFIYNFKNVFNKLSKLQKKYNHLDFNFFEGEYINHGYEWSIGERIILKNMLYIFDIDDGVLGEESLDLIFKEDKYYYDDLLKLINNGFNSTFEKIVSNHFDSIKIETILNDVIKNAEEKEKEYIKSEKLNDDKIKLFDKILKENALKDNKLIEYIKSQHKVEYSSAVIKKVLGINQLIPRQLFLDSLGGYETLAKDYGASFPRGIADKYINNIEEFADILETPIEEYIKELQNPNEFLIILNDWNYHHLKIDNKTEDYILIKEQKLDVLKLQMIDGIILINKKYLPKIEYGSFDKEFNKDKVENSFFYEMTDCSKNPHIRREIMEKATWIKEKGDQLVQEEYLKQQCRIRVYMAVKINNIRNAKAIKVNKNIELGNRVN